MKQENLFVYLINDLQGCNFLSQRIFKNKNSMRYTLMDIGKCDWTFDNTETPLREFTLDFLFDLWGLEYLKLSINDEEVISRFFSKEEKGYYSYDLERYLTMEQAIKYLKEKIE